MQRSARLNPRLQGHWDKYGPRYLVDVTRGDAAMSLQPETRFDLPRIFEREAPTTLEIGSGRGEAIAHAASIHPERDFLACEVYTPGVAGILGRVGQNDLPNVRVLHADATHVLDFALPPASLDEVWVFFPDPWHKSRHNKRRLINDDFARLVARVLAPGGRWRIATDWQAYADQVAHVIEDSADFEGGAADRFELRPLTRFEQKAHREGRSVWDFTAVRTENSSNLKAQ